MERARINQPEPAADSLPRELTLPEQSDSGYPAGSCLGLS